MFKFVLNVHFSQIVSFNTTARRFCVSIYHYPINKDDKKCKLSENRQRYLGFK